MEKTIEDWLKTVSVNDLCNLFIRLNDWNADLYANYNLMDDRFNLFYLKKDISGCRIIPSDIWATGKKATLEIFIKSFGGRSDFTAMEKEKVTVEI